MKGSSAGVLTAPPLPLLWNIYMHNFDKFITEYLDKRKNRNYKIRKGVTKEREKI